MKKVAYEKVYQDSDYEDCHVVIHGDNCEIIPVSQYKHSYRRLVRLYITPELIDLLCSKFDFKKKSRKILDLGGTYVLDTKHGFYIENDYMLAADLASSEYVKKSLSVDVRIPTSHAFQERSIIGNFLEPRIQNQIIQVLDGKPNIIIASQVLISDLPEYMRHENLFSVLTDELPLDEMLSAAAWDMLEDNGLLIVNNVVPHKSSDASIPHFLSQKSDYLKFLIEDGLTRVYQKTH